MFGLVERLFLLTTNVWFIAVGLLVVSRSRYDTVVNCVTQGPVGWCPSHGRPEHLTKRNGTERRRTTGQINQTWSADAHWPSPSRLRHRGDREAILVQLDDSVVGDLMVGPVYEIVSDGGQEAECVDRLRSRGDENSVSSGSNAKWPSRELRRASSSRQDRQRQPSRPWFDRQPGSAHMPHVAVQDLWP